MTTPERIDNIKALVYDKDQPFTIVDLTGVSVAEWRTAWRAELPKEGIPETILINVVDMPETTAHMPAGDDEFKTRALSLGLQVFEGSRIGSLMGIGSKPKEFPTNYTFHHDLLIKMFSRRFADRFASREALMAITFRVLDQLGVTGYLVGNNIKVDGKKVASTVTIVHDTFIHSSIAVTLDIDWDVFNALYQEDMSIKITSVKQLTGKVPPKSKIAKLTQTIISDIFGSPA